jgi:hypothetical protein
MKEQNIGFILGFIAGEGCFRVQPRVEKGKLYPRPIFTINVHDGDVDIVRTLHECVEIGRVYVDENNHQCRWEVVGWKECEEFASQIISTLDGSLFTETTKYDQFIRWVEFIQSYETPQTYDEAKEVLEQAKDIPSTKERRGKSVEEWMKRLKYPEE